MTTVAVPTDRRGRSGDPRPEKVAVVDEVREKLAPSSAAILTEYRGLKVSELESLRRTLRQAGGEYKIYKNTLVRFATKDLGIQGLDPMLEGPTAIAFADTDVPAVAKALRDFSRTNPLLVVKGGVMGSTVLTPGDAERWPTSLTAGAARSSGRTDRRSHAAVRRPAAGAAEKPGVRPVGPHRPARRARDGLRRPNWRRRGGESCCS